MTEIQIVPGSVDWKRYRQLARTNLYWLCSTVLGLQDKIPMTPRAHLAMCLFASRQTGIPEIDQCRVQLIHVARGWGKSGLITQGRTIQRILQDRNWAAAIANEKAGNAEAFLAGIKTHFTVNDFLKALFPELIPDPKSTVWRSDRITINRDSPDPVNPSVLAAGVDTAVTGIHMNEWIVDDLISDEAYENARTGTFTEIEKANRWVDRLEYLLKNPKRDPLTFIGTPWYPGDCYDYLRDELFGKGERQEFIWTVKLPDGEFQQIPLVRQGELAIFKLKPLADGKPIFPERYSLEVLEGLRQDKPHLYASQIMLEPTAGEMTAFKEEWLREWKWSGLHQITFQNREGERKFARVRDLPTLLSVDPAISEKSTAARSAITITGADGENIFLLEAWAERCSPSVLAMQIIKFYKDYSPQRIIIESVVYQIALAEILSLMAQEHLPGIQLPIYEFQTGSQQKKQLRIMGLEPYFKKGLLYVNPESQQAFLEEYRNFSPYLRNRLMDLLDALSFQIESWEHLAFLSERAETGGFRAKWAEGQRAAATRVREFFGKRRTREWAESERF